MAKKAQGSRGPGSAGSRRKARSDSGKESVTSATAAFLREMLDGAAVFFQVDHSERVWSGKAELAKSGVMPGGTGHGAYGYNRQTEDGRRVVNEAEARIVLRIFTEFDHGEEIGKIVRRLNDEGVPSKRGMKWGYAVVRSILQNETYIGMDYYGKTRTVRGRDGGVIKVSVAKEDCIRIAGFSPPIVPEPLFWRVQAKLRELKTRVL